MPTYSLRFPKQGAQVEKMIEFEAINSAEALSLADQEAEGRCAELFENGSFMCKLVKIGHSNLWLVDRAPNNVAAIPRQGS